jgi:glycosyltransferase involved in cell wall biosynthesis
MIEIIGWVIFALSALPVMMALTNAPFFRQPPARLADAAAAETPASVLIPARDEAERIGPTLDAVLASKGSRFEVVVLDDGSTDATAQIVRQYAQHDSRVRLLHGAPLPAGWSGKQHACYQLAQAAAYDVLVWLDADVQLRPEALRRGVAALHHSKASLLSGFPFQRTRSWSEHLVVPMIHVLLLGYLPFWAMRLFRHPGFAAGCGQFFIADRSAYEAMGGHARIAASFHDGITLPRAFRVAGFHTDIFDATDLASCRMYEGLGALWSGFVKNAHEGLARPIALPVWTVLLIGGHVLPWFLLVLVLLPLDTGVPVTAVIGSCILAVGYSVGVGWKYAHPLPGILARPLGVLLLLAIQWHALVRRWRGRPTPWRGRTQPHDGDRVASQMVEASAASGERA